MHDAILDVFEERCAKGWPTSIKILLEMYPPLRLTIEMCARPHIEAAIELLRCGAWLGDDEPVEPPDDEFFMPNYCLAALLPPREPMAAPAAPGIRTWFDVVPRDIVGIVYRYLRRPGHFLDWPHGMRVVRSGDDFFDCGWYQYGVTRRDDGVPAAVEMCSRMQAYCGIAAYSQPFGIPRYGSGVPRAFDRNLPTIVVLRDDNDYDFPSQMVSYVMNAQSAFAIHDEDDTDIHLASFQHIGPATVAYAIRGLGQ